MTHFEVDFDILRRLVCPVGAIGLAKRIMK